VIIKSGNKPFTGEFDLLGIFLSNKI